MNQPPENDSPPDSYQAAIGRVIKPWFSFAVVGLFVFACFYTLKLAKDLFLPIILAGFLGFLLTPVTRWLRKIGLTEFWAPLIGTLGFLTLLLCLFGALWFSLAQFQPDFPQYLDHIQERLAPIIASVHKSSASMDRLSNWLNPGSNREVSVRGPSIIEIALSNAPTFLALIIVVHVLVFFLLLYGARLLKKFVDMIPGVSEKQNVVEIAAEIDQTAARYF